MHCKDAPFDRSASMILNEPPSPVASCESVAGSSIFDTAWWFMTFPGLALLLTVLSFNLVGDGLQDALNPRTQQ